ncbi:MAG TPA: glycosyltransferase [Sedimentisphaerales bacterium]|nr:glycosyltransferase [Sedimentisphaerales bacterium]
MSFLSDASYRDVLNERIGALDDPLVREHVKGMFETWYQQYRGYRGLQRAIELLASEESRPSVLYLSCESDLQLMHALARVYRFDERLFRGFLIADELWAGVKPEWFSPFAAYRASDWRDSENTVVLTLSNSRPFRDNGRDRGNDYQECFIDLSRLSPLAEIRRKHADRRIVLYADYRKVKTFEAIAESISGRYVTVGLTNDPKANTGGYQHVVHEPHAYLWPLIFRMLKPDLIHVNVGWGTQGVPFMACVPDADRAIVDFYDVLDFMPDELLDAHHPEPRRLTRASEKYLWTGFKHFVHRCSDIITDDLKKQYPQDDIVSLVEYVKDPVYSQMPTGARDLKLVYGGIIIQNAAEKESVFYRRFESMVNFFAKDNLHLYIYPSPYLYGFGRPKAVEELIQAQGLANVHACAPLEEDDWVREISGHDYGIFIFSDTRPSVYPHILPFKFIAYLRAGLPVIVPEDQTFMADLVDKHGIGVIYRYEDSSRMAEILAGQDLRALKENVVRFRSSWTIGRGGAKVAAMYDRMLHEGMPKTHSVASVPAQPQPCRPAPVPVATPLDDCSLSLDGRDYLSEQEYTQYLEARIEQAGPSLDREYVRKKQADWSCLYQVDRMARRAGEMLGELHGKPYVLYLNDVLSLHATAQMFKESTPQGLRGFVIEDELLARLDAQVFGQHPVYPRSRAGEVAVTIFSVSGRVPAEGAPNCLASDYREKFIDLRRFDPVREIRRRLDGHDVILYPLYREIHTVAIMAAAVRRRDDRLWGVGLSPRPMIDEGFDEVLVEPFLYLWPLIFQIVDPSVVHLNVGWGIQALPLSPYIPDPKRAVIDFYEVLGFLPDAYFYKTHSTGRQVRSAEEHFIKSYDHVIHLCSEETSTRLAKKYDSRADIVSVTEYLQQPTYSGPTSSDGLIRLVYGGCMLASTNPDDLYYRAFMTVAPHFARENLHLYIYNNPYVGATGENDALKELIRKHGLVNIHPCVPLPLEEFVRKISEYDYGATFLRPKDMEGVDYNYFMAYKFLSYLRAGLPVVIDCYNHYMAGLVERHHIGMVLQERDMENLPRILNAADVASLKRNVVEFRDRFSIDKGGEKVVSIYREILDRSRLHAMRSVAARRRRAPERKAAAPAEDRAAVAADKTDSHAIFEGMIDVMARREKRLYYRDQSAPTMSSLAALARQLNPSVIVELGTLGGLSLRTWIGSTKQTRIYAVDLSFQTLRETMKFLPADLSRVTLLEQDILKTDFARLWSPQDKVIFFVDAHDLPEVPIMKHVLETALPSLPDESLVVVDDLWFSEERLTNGSARAFLEDRVCSEIDELQCFNGHYAPYHEGGSFLGFAEVIPLLEFVNRHGIPLVHEPGSKHVSFVWKKAYLSSDRGPAACGRDYGSAQHNPLESVPVSTRHSQMMREIAHRYLRKDIRGAAESLLQALNLNPHDPGLSYGLAVCLARGGMLSQARDVLAGNLGDSSSPRYRRLFDDLVRRVGAPEPCPVPPAKTSPAVQGLTIFTMPKAFSGHAAIIQKNAIRSWARLDPRPEILLFGDEPGIREMAEEIGARHVAEVARNELGTPRVDSLFEAAQSLASHGVLAYVNADIILMHDFATAVQKVQSRLSHFLLIGRRWDLDVLDEIDFHEPGWQESLRRQLDERGTPHAESGLDYFVFRKGLWSRIPPFAIGRTAWDNWLVADPQRRGVPVVDGTESISAVHQDHDYQHAVGGRHGAWNGQEAVKNRSLAGPLDESACTTGASWILRAEGPPVLTSPRQPQAGTLGFRARRIAWLVKQAEWLTVRGRTDLAACKWEETLGLLDKLMSFQQRSGASNPVFDEARATRCYMAACVSLADCCAKLGRMEQAMASYTRFLESPWVQIPQAQREELTRLRDRLLGQASRNRTPALESCESPGDKPAACKRIALIVSIPDRQEGLRGVIRDIEGQVDEIRILLNESETVPQDLYACRKVSRIEISRTGELFASGAWTLLRPEDDAYVFVLDDDIHYPADYVPKMIASIEARQRRAVAVVHGFDFCEPYADCVRDRLVYRFESARSRDGVVDAGGVGTLAFHTDTIRPDLKDFPNPNFRDLWFSVLAARAGVPIVCVARDPHWLHSRDVQGKQLWYLFNGQGWRERKSRVFRENLLPLLDLQASGRDRTRDLTIFCITNGRSTFEYSARSVAESADLRDRAVVLANLDFLDAMARCVEQCETPYFLKVDDDFILHPKALAYMRDRVLAYPRPEELGIYYFHLWEDWTSRVRESIKIYSLEALRKIGGFQPDHLGKVDRTTLARLEQAGFKVVADPSVVAIHACGTWQEQLEYERLWSAGAGTPYQKPTHDAMKAYCGTKSLSQQYDMRLDFLESVNRQLGTPFQEFLGGKVALSRSAPAATAAESPGTSRDNGLTIFAMPKAFTGHTGTIQKNAIRSWALLEPRPEIILFGDETGIREMAEEVGAQHLPFVSRNEFGTPLVDKLFLAAQERASHEVLAYVNADMILLQDFVQGVQSVQSRLPSFLLIGQRWDVPILQEIDFRGPQWRLLLQKQLQQDAMLHAECGLDYFVFRKGLWPEIPPFAIGRTAWDNWLVMNPRKRGIPVVDGTERITAVHQDHAYGHVAGGRQEAWNGVEATRNRTLAGPADHHGLTTGATWLLRPDGSMVETGLRRPHHIRASYRSQRSAWLVRQARELLAVGARELAACKCEESLSCMDGWMELRQAGRIAAGIDDHNEIASRYVACHTLLARCHMQMGQHEQVFAAYTRLLANPNIQIPEAQRQLILETRDRLAAGLRSPAPVENSSSEPSLEEAACEGAGPLVETTAGDSRPKVTVVTACRNGQRYLKECVDSILGQTLTDWELILIDDGSTDGTRRMMEEFARSDPRIQACHFPDNRGPYVRRNFAIRRAAADFIVIQDADDIMLPTKLQRLHEAITRDDGLGIVGSAHRTFLETFRGLERTEHCELPVDHETIVASCASWQAAISHGMSIIRKSLFETVGLYDENPFAADAFWSAKLALYSQIGAPVKLMNLAEPLTLIRVHPGSQTQMLPVFDPRGRRVRYRHYCECKLRRIREKWRQQADLDVAAELRNCSCSDFLVRFKAKIIEWESEELAAHFVNDLLIGALSSFRRKAYVSCVIILNGLEVMRRDLPRQVKGFDLLRAMALCGSGLCQRGLTHLEREIEHHDDPLAHQLLRDLDERGDSMAVQDWFLQNAADLELRLSGEERERIRVAMA